MSDEKKKRLCPDPDCKTETDAENQNCSKCGIDIDGFNLIDRALSLREKIANKKKEEEHPAPEPRRGLSALAGRKK
jgi:hypothetical protein